ncbi:MAG: GNAT family N-acetyltransferase [Gammaproteobacteria bacterium]|nr:GNAT family N-acetyltransferase [Gammaproteobacteria bacterium]MDD9874760.1 GNAT family N-acetyltransferase [Gammaproteobacteria bacterium]
MPCPVVRAAAVADAAAINRIYNHYVHHTAVTFDIEPWSTPRRRAWIAQFTGNPHHALVAELDGAVAGFAFNHRFRDKAAYRHSTETTIYTAPENQARGIGTALYENLFERIEKTELHRAYAVIALPNPRSIALHRRFGFTRIGTLHQVGHKFGRYIDVAWFEKALR